MKTDEEFLVEDHQEIDEAVSSYLATVPEVETETVNLAEVLEKLSSLENFQRIPEDFNTAEFVTSLTKTKEVTEVIRSLKKSVNDIFSYLSHPETLPKTRLFLGAQWGRIFTLIRKQVSADVNKKVQRKEFTCHFADLHSLLVSNELEKEFAELVGIPVQLLVEHHYHVLTEIVMALNSHILKVIIAERFPSSSVDGHGTEVSKMTEESKGKNR